MPAEVENLLRCTGPTVAIGRPRLVTVIVPPVVLTSSNEITNIQDAYALGANSYITKSIDYDEFARAAALIYHYWCQLNIYPE